LKCEALTGISARSLGFGFHEHPLYQYKSIQSSVFDKATHSDSITQISTIPISSPLLSGFVRVSSVSKAGRKQNPGAIAEVVWGSSIASHHRKQKGDERLEKRDFDQKLGMGWDPIHIDHPWYN
jgi:hypothetical protein